MSSRAARSRGARRSGSWVATTTARSPSSASVASSSSAPAASSALNGSSRTSRPIVQQHAAERGRCCIPRDPHATAHLPANRSSSIDPLAPVGRGTASRRGAGSRRRQLAERRLMPGSRPRERAAELALRRRGEARAPGNVVFPAPRLGDEQEVAARELDVDAVEDALHAEALRGCGPDHVGLPSAGEPSGGERLNSTRPRASSRTRPRRPGPIRIIADARSLGARDAPLLER
jgi:hypothetical protein